MYVASLTGMTREKRNHIRHHQPQKPTVRESGVAPVPPIPHVGDGRPAGPALIFLVSLRNLGRIIASRPPFRTGDGCMNRYRIFIFAAATLSAALWAYACGDGTTEPPTPPPDPPRPTTVTVTPATTQLTALGATVQLSAGSPRPERAGDGGGRCDLDKQQRFGGYGQRIRSGDGGGQRDVHDHSDCGRSVGDRNGDGGPGGGRGRSLSRSRHAGGRRHPALGGRRRRRQRASRWRVWTSTGRPSDTAGRRGGRMRA